MDKATEAKEAKEATEAKDEDDEDDMPLSSWLKSQDAEAKRRRQHDAKKRKTVTTRPALKGPQLTHATGGAQGGSMRPDRSVKKMVSGWVYRFRNPFSPSNIHTL